MSSRISQDRLVETGVHSPLTDKQPVTVGLGRQFAFGERLPGRVYSRSPTRLVGFTHFVGDRDTLYYPGQANRPWRLFFFRMVEIADRRLDGACVASRRTSHRTT